ncbi:MAG: hypothetical protein ACPGO3_13770 [Magnetospiraceae bacterium]
MIEIDSDNPEVEKQFRLMAEVILDSGGSFEPSVKILCQEGNLTVVANTASRSKAPTMHCPESCLLPMDEVQLALDGGEMAVVKTPDYYSTERRALLEAMLAIYRETRKISTTRETSFWFTLAETPDIFEHFLGPRKMLPKFQYFFKMFESDDTEQLLINYFLGSRTLAYRSPASEGQDVQTEEMDPADDKFVLMPFVDFANHHEHGAPFDSRRGGVALGDVRPIPGSREIFARYGIIDGLDCYLNYGFVDTGASFVRAAPMEVDLEGLGTLKIGARVMSPVKKKLSGKIAGLRTFIPRVLTKTEDMLEASHLFIPGHRSPQALVRVISLLIRSMDRVAPDQIIREQVRQVEEAVIAMTETYYTDLQKMTESASLGASTRDSLNTLATHQLRKIRAYKPVFAGV